MGIGIFSQPLFDSIKNQDRLHEVVILTTRQLQETFSYIQQNERKTGINLDGFIDVFGNLVDDAELFFGDFRFPDLPICDPMEVLCFFALFCGDSMREKVEFLFSVHKFRKTEIMKGTGLYLLLRRVFSAFSRIFQLPIIDNTSIATLVNSMLFAYVERSNKGETTVINAAIIAQEEKEDPLSHLITNNAIRFNFVEFYQYLQESKDSCTFLESISSFCSTLTKSSAKWRATHPQLAAMNNLSDVDDENNQLSEKQNQTYIIRPRHPLWNYNVIDIMQESWLATSPTCTTEDYLFSVLEHLVLSDRRALPIFVDTPIPHSTSMHLMNPMTSAKSPGIALKRSTPHHANHQTPRSVGFFRGEPLKQESDTPHAAAVVAHSIHTTPISGHQNQHSTPHHGHHSIHSGHKVKRPQHNHQYVGVIDFNTIVAWIAINTPESLTSRIAAEENIRKEKLKKDLELRAAQGQHWTPRNTVIGPGLHAHGNRSESITIPLSLASIGKQDSLPKAAGTQWQAVGEMIAISTVKETLLGIASHGVIADSGLNKKRIESILNPQASHSFGMSVHVASKPQPTDSHSSPVLQADQFLYDVVLLIAQGHRSIPISFQPDKPHSPDLVITDVEIASFLRENAAEVLGSLARISISKCDFMKKPISVSCTANFGSALYTMACRNVDTLVILDMNGKIGCRLSVDCVKRLWWTWKQQMTETAIVQSELKEAYANGTYVVHNGSSGSVFSMFSCLLTPLRSCEDFGINVINFDRFVNDTIKSDEEKNSDNESNSSSDESVSNKKKQAEVEESEPMFQSPACSPETLPKRFFGTPQASPRNASENNEFGNDLPTPTTPIAATALATPASSMKTPQPPSKSISSRALNQNPRRIVKVPTSPNRFVGRGVKGKKKFVKPKPKKKPVKRPALAENERQRRLSSWFKEMGAVQLSDTLNMALEAMFHVHSTRALVSNCDGEVVGVISIVDICRELLSQEAQLKSVQLSTILKSDRF